MEKKKLSEDQLIAELNTALREDDDFAEGMVFIPFPPGSVGREMSGYSTLGPFHLTGVYARVAHAVFAECELDTR